METRNPCTRAGTPHRLWKLAVLALPCVLCAASREVVPPARPVVPPGGNNWIPPSGAVTRALSTQDLNTGLTPTDLVTSLLGPGVAVSNVMFTGTNPAAGTFSGGTGIIGFANGIILSSGDIAFVPGPNTQDDISANNALNGDPDLDALIPGYITYDACVLEFDFECAGTQSIQFQYVFTSEEYNEWVNSDFNDVFAFFLNGVNIADIPGGGGLAVSIDNLNCNNPYNPPTGSFCNLHINNDCSDLPPGTFPCTGTRDTQMDGLTVVLTATGTLNPGLNHIKLAIADAGDPVLDSNVFIASQSFVCGTPTGACCDTSTLTCTDNVLEADCQGASDVWSVGLACSQLQPPCAVVTYPPGTDCANPIAISAVPYTDINTTGDKENDYSDTCLGYYDNGGDIIYVLSIASPQCIDITVEGASSGDNWFGVVLDTVCPPSGACLAQTTTSSTVAAISNLELAAGTYYLMIDRWPLIDDSLDFTLYIGKCGGLTGDLNCDGAVDFGDINPFVLILSDPAAWQAAYPGCPTLNGDIDGNGTVGFEDINPFVTLLSGG